MAGGGGLLRLWSEWEIQIMVLVSFALQVLLLACGGTRRHSSSTVLRIVLWLTYLSADSTAIYTLGRLSVASSCRSPSGENLLVAFWAPFLLLHLGGPDNITAYALEDNRLWLRHLQTLAVQALGAAYVVYKFIFSARSQDRSLLLLAASISMFAAGLAKYGERVWALKCGNISSSFDKSDGNSREPLRRLTGDEGEGETDKEEILLRAHSHFDICKGIFADVSMKVHDSSAGSSTNQVPESAGSSTNPVLSESMITYLYKLVEMELSLMYDILYTKVAVIHTWYGFCIHCISLLGTVAAFVLFQISIVIISSSGDGYTYSRANVVISYVLLVGALVLEAASLCKAILSTWTCSFLYRSGWKRLLHLITYLRRRVQPARRRLWSGSIGQYNLLNSSTSDRNGVMCWLAKKMGFEGWWNKLPNFMGSEFCSIEDLKELVLKEMVRRDTEGNSRGIAALRKNSLSDTYYNWIIEMDLDVKILVWHIATDLAIRVPFYDDKVNKRLLESIKVLSNYMMFLLVVKPDMLPGRTRRSLYLNACNELNCCWSDCSKAWSPLEDVAPPHADLLAHWLLGDWYHKVRIDPFSGYVSQDIYNPSHDRVEIQGLIVEAPEHGKEVYNAIGIYYEVTRLEMIFQVWVEMMMYVAEHCSRDSHARQLNQGTEFITIMWLMTHHLKYYSFRSS